VGAAIAGDGKSFAYGYDPNDGEGALYIRSLDGTRVDTIARGHDAAFSEDSRWIGWLVSTPEKEARKLRKQRKPVPESFGLQATAGGERLSIPDVRSFTFSRTSRWVAIHKSHTGQDTSFDGADLIVRDLQAGTSTNIGNVLEFAFDSAGDKLAWLVDAADRAGNGIYVMDLASGRTTPLNTAQEDYAQLAWSRDGTRLATLRGLVPKGMVQRKNVLVVVAGVGSAKPTVTEYNAAQDASIPKELVVSDLKDLEWSRDGQLLFLGLKEQQPELPKADDENPLPNVDVWHWNDDEVQSVQIVRAQAEKRFTWLAVYEPKTRSVSRLTDDSLRTADLTDNSRWAIGRDETPYRGEVAWGGSHADYYRLNVVTGERKLIAKGLGRSYGTSPDSRWFLYQRDSHLIAYEIASGRTVDLSAASKVDLIDKDDDHPYEVPVYGIAGWSRDGKSVLAYQDLDLWQLPLDGSMGRNLTKGVGEKEQIRFRLVRLDQPSRGRGFRGRGRAQAPDDVDDLGVDLTKPLVLSAYGKWTKKSGYYELKPGGTPEALAFDDVMYGSLLKAKHADRVAFTKQTFTMFPDWWVSSTSLDDQKRVTDADPQLIDYAWGRRELIDFTNSKGQRLQGTLTLPANYEPGKKYPMLVYFYETLSQTHHQFSMPVYDDRPHMSEYASDGYLVFEPDIVYEIGKPGSSALDCVTSGVKKVIELGYADPAHIGIQGHSWGGYETSFILTHSTMFAAVVTGAPPTNLVSFYDETYPGSGTLQQGIVEVGQVRMGTNPWDSPELFESQSAIPNVRAITAPFLILHGTADNAVDWHQGLELYAAARRWGKHVILLSYPGEPHHLSKEENQKDFQIRMKQFFDHYLKGAPAPAWMTDGVPFLEKNYEGPRGPRVVTEAQATARRP
jgi:dipeptidyl aminopeptidase/acylaminoacyl peptidase